MRDVHIYRTLLLLMAVFAVHGRQIYMDSPVACGQRFTVADNPVTIRPRSTVGSANPPANCDVFLESGYQGQNYKLKIVAEAARFDDCSLQLRIFDGPSIGGEFIKMLGCGTTANIGEYYLVDRAVTLSLTRAGNRYFFNSYFQLRIHAYNTDVTTIGNGANKTTIGTTSVAKHYVARPLIIYMDSPMSCGQRFTVTDNPVMVKPRSTVGLANPPANCDVFLESGYQGQNYKWKIVVEAASFGGCSLQLNIYDGPSVGRQHIRTLGCGTTAITDEFYTVNQAVTLSLTRARDQYFFNSDFQIRIQKVYRTNATTTNTEDNETTTDGHQHHMSRPLTVLHPLYLYNYFKYLLQAVNVMLFHGM